MDNKKDAMADGVAKERVCVHLPDKIRWNWHLPVWGLPQRHRASPSAALDERVVLYYKKS